MDPISGIIGGASGLISGIGGLFSAGAERKQRRQAAELAQKGVAELQGGLGYDPAKALEFLGLTNKSAYDSMDPASKAASMEALAQLVKRGAGTGLDIQSKQALSSAIARTGAAQNAARQAVLQEMMARGGANQGDALAGMLSGVQGNYGNLAEATGQASAAAEQRRLEANVLASRAGQQQQQLEQQKAAALDALQRFNVGARQNTLDLERQYRQGAAGQYLGAGQVMAGMAPSAGKPIQSGADALAGLLGKGYQAGQAAGWWGGGSQGGDTTGYDFNQGYGGGSQSPDLGNWSMQLNQPTTPYQYGQDIPQTNLKKGSAW